MRDIFEELLETIENNAVDNKITITDVKHFISGWREEKQMDVEHQLFSMINNEDVKPPVVNLPQDNDVYGDDEGVTFSFPLILQTLEGHFVPQMMDLLNEYGLILRVVKRDGILT